MDCIVFAKYFKLFVFTSIFYNPTSDGVIKRFDLNRLNNNRNNYKNNKYENRLRRPPTVVHVHSSFYDSRNRIDIMVKCERVRPFADIAYL